MITESALTDTLTALENAVRLVLEVASTRHEDTRAEAVSVAESALSDVSVAISSLAKAAADEPTLFMGQRVGDGLDQERSDAQLAMSMLRTVVNSFVGVDENPYEALARGQAVVVRFAGSWVLSKDHLRLFCSLLDEKG